MFELQQVCFGFFGQLKLLFIIIVDLWLQHLFYYHLYYQVLLQATTYG